MTKVIGIIPARLESKRLPGKLLLNATGKPLIVHTIEQAKKCSHLWQLVVATDSEEIAKVCRDHCPVVMTSSYHMSGTSRCYQAFKEMYPDGIGGAIHRGGSEYIIVNIQGEQPEISHGAITIPILQMRQNMSGVATVACKITEEEFHSNSAVKVVSDARGKAMYFSRSPIPNGNPHLAKKHIGVYAFTESTLYHCCDRGPSKIAEAEGLEQLRWMHYGITVNVGELLEHHPSGIDTPEDYESFCERFRKQER